MKLDFLTAKYPKSTDLIERLGDFIQAEVELEAKGVPPREYSVNRIFDELHPDSAAVLVAVLEDLVVEGFLSKKFVVESPTLGGIGSFDSIIDVPSVIHDWRTDQEIVVDPSNIKVFFSVA